MLIHDSIQFTLFTALYTHYDLIRKTDDTLSRPGDCLLVYAELIRTVCPLHLRLSILNTQTIPILNLFRLILCQLIRTIHFSVYGDNCLLCLFSCQQKKSRTHCCYQKYASNQNIISFFHSCILSEFYHSTLHSGMQPFIRPYVRVAFFYKNLRIGMVITRSTA